MEFLAVGKNVEVADERRRPSLWADPRTPLGFSSLLTIGVVAIGLPIALISPDPEARLCIAVGGGLAIAICWGLTLVIFWSVLLFRSLVAVVHLCLSAWAGGGPGKKPEAMPAPAGLSDAWLDGP